MPESPNPLRQSLSELRDHLTSAQRAASSGAGHEVEQLLEAAAAQVARLDRLVQQLDERAFVATGDVLVGSYRGTVVEDIDPAMRGRLRISVPVIDSTEMWAEVVAPLSDAARTAPAAAVGSSVWVVFEQGDRRYPVVLGAMIG